jgi:hypothetical protein
MSRNLLAMAIRVANGVRLWALKAFVAVCRINDISDSVWHSRSTTMEPSTGEIVFMVEESCGDIG